MTHRQKVLQFYPRAKLLHAKVLRGAKLLRISGKRYSYIKSMDDNYFILGWGFNRKSTLVWKAAWANLKQLNEKEMLRKLEQ
jgi:hypothetical protein